MYVFGIDVETTGLDPEIDEIIEIGIVIWDWEKKVPVRLFNDFVKGDKPIPNEIIKLTGITNEIRITHGWDKENIKNLIELLLMDLRLSSEVEYGNRSPFVMAHNAKFDRSFLEKIIDYDNIQWLCSMDDIDYPEHITTRKLSYLASEHGFINPFNHRAMFDVLTMFQIAKNYDFNKIIENSRQRKVELTALVSYEDREKAKSLGYHWENRKWCKTIRENQVQIEMDKAKQSEIETKWRYIDEVTNEKNF